MQRKYAERTKVPAQQSRMEIEKTLKRYGASGFAYYEEGNIAAVAFKMAERHIRMSLTLPSGSSNKDDQGSAALVARAHNDRQGQARGRGVGRLNLR